MGKMAEAIRETGSKEDVGAEGLLSISQRNPYYIVAPRYVRTSAGIKVLHLLCHALNRAGERAYIVTHPYYIPERATNPDLQTPLLTQSVLDRDFKKGRCPITIYAEVVRGNPFNAPMVVRYVLNYPGLLGGDSEYDKSEYCVAYSKAIGEVVPAVRATLFVPASDASVFGPEPGRVRKGSCFYAAKYRDYHGGRLLDITNDSTEITRDKPDSQKPQEIAELFRRSEVFYCYENTALAIEAVLCECPVVFIPNQYFDRVIAAEEHGWDGMAWGTAPEEIARAKATVQKARQNYLNLYRQFEQQLEVFIAETQDEAWRITYNTQMAIPYLSAPSVFSKILAAVEIIRSLVHEKGVKDAFAMTLRRVMRRGFTLLP